ncbi:caspase family protein [Streptomyces cinnabarinus]|uniref:Caspase family protein n=1 Tax=Streptomyces cinnabarinus TaxID=67287 RepID=A0ABY7KTV6_9ACTN|nr:caspase family protein [Streptomyces cinnabarinus]WAZ26527.1 caspase family protein [Streptomyces cinnabarinus]
MTADTELSRAVLIGCAEYASLSPLPAVARNLAGLSGSLTDRRLWGLNKQHCSVLLNQDRIMITDILDRASQSAQDLLLVYYAGHGLCAERDGALHLATPATRADRLWAALEFDQVRQAFLRTRATRKVLLLDCCFGGRAIGSEMAASSAQFADRALIEGTYTMTATAPTRTALAPLDAKYTAFTGELITVLGSGIPEAGQILDCQTLFEHVLQRCLSKSYPQPQQRSTGMGARIPLVRNLAHRNRPRSVTLRPLDLSLDSWANDWLPPGSTEVNAVVTVTARDTADRLVPDISLRRQGIVFLLGCKTSATSGSANWDAARHATAEALEFLPDGVRFAIVSGAATAAVIYPDRAGPAPASRATRREARTALERMRPRPGSAFAPWLRAARTLLADLDHGHVVLLTDALDERPEELAAALNECRGRLSADVRGIGTDWSVPQLTGIANALLGSADIVADPAGLPSALCETVARWAGTAVANPLLRIWTPEARVRCIKQVSPYVQDLTQEFTGSGRETRDYPLGIWGEESRDYHLALDLAAARRPGIEVLAAAVAVIRPDANGNDETVGQRLLRVRWGPDAQGREDQPFHTSYRQRNDELRDAVRRAMRPDPGQAAPVEDRQ